MQAQRFSLHLLLITRMRPSSPLLASELLHDDFRKKVTNVTFPLLSLFCRKAEKLSTQRCKASFTASFCRKSFRPRCWTNSAFAWIKAPHISQRPTPPCGTSSRRLQIATDIHKCRYLTVTHCGKSQYSTIGRSVCSYFINVVFNSPVERISLKAKDSHGAWASSLAMSPLQSATTVKDLRKSWKELCYRTPRNAIDLSPKNSWIIYSTTRKWQRRSISISKVLFSLYIKDDFRSDRALKGKSEHP